MIKLILQTLWLFLPALLGNMAPPLVRNYFSFLAKPIDFGLKFRGKRLLGNNKTLRGLVCGVLVGIIIAGLQKLLYTYDVLDSSSVFQWLSVLDYGTVNFILLGFLLSFGALFGDIIESFFKRQLGIKPGKPFFPFDQVDFLLGAILFLLIIFNPGWRIIVALLVLGILLHLLTNLIGYFIGVNKRII